MNFMRMGKREVAVQEESGALEVVREVSLDRGSWIETDQAIAACFAVAACLVHFLWNGRYGYFRDELYYAACGQHLAWGYVDQAPLIAVIARVSRMLFGDSLHALRFFPALAAGAKLLLTGWIVRELGGQRYAQILAGTAMLLCPIYLTMDNFLSMNAFEPVFWMLCVAISIRIVRTGNDGLWLWFGLIAGIGILNKHSTLIFGLAFLLGLIATRQRALLRSSKIWLGGLISLLIFLPNFIWEARNHWPTIEILQNVDRMKNMHVTWMQFIVQQTFLVHPLGAPICVAGLWFFLRGREGEPFRYLGWTYCFLLAEFLILRGRIYYLAPIYPMLFAAGAVAIEAWIAGYGRNWVKTAILTPLVVGGLVAAPLALPILPLDAAAQYANYWDVDRVQVEKEPSGKLPQMYADMMGWPQQADAVAGVFHSLSPGEQSRVAILAGNYGQAGAIDYFGPSLGLPHAISGHNNYYLWGPGNFSGDVVISVGVPLDQLRAMFGEIDVAATINNEYAIPEENNLPVYICRKPKMTLQQAWPSLKFFG
ncbi:MAG TPA: glycosyltransferase family 39 protein [Candidatus Acidoferrales bacterium]|nr:glycosyltransferase family 39 protein [Candidatus Acidoferrales bacterium]